MVTLGVQVAVDCLDPHPLADWWAEALGWQVEPQDESFIRQMVEGGHATEADTTTHRDSLVWRDGAAIVAPSGTEGPCPRILFQRTDQPRQGKNRVHLDLRALDPATDLAAIRRRLEEHGATRLWEASQGPHSWVTFADPEGNEFCI